MTKRFTFVVGNKDDFSSIDALMSAYEDIKEMAIFEVNMGVFHYTLPADTADSTAMLRGEGYAFDASWTRPGTYSFCQVEEDEN